MTPDRSYRTAPQHRFNGGYTGHGNISPMEQPGLLSRILRPLSRKDSRNGR